METIKGRRVYSQGSAVAFRSGDYGKGPAGNWLAWPPGTDLLAGLDNHEITEHEDGSITVSPSILLTGFDEDGNPIVWHGYLEAGIWRSV